jgi:serine protease Do
MPKKVASAQQIEQPTVALGMELVPLTPQLRSQLQVPKHVNGVVIDRIASDSPARALGLQTGDVIESIDQKPVTSPVEAAGQLKEAANQGNVLLLVNRHGTNEFFGLSIENNGTAGSSSP